MRKYKLISIALLIAVTLTSCKDNPESSIVKHKDLDKLIEEAKATPNSSATPSPDLSATPGKDLSETKEKYDSYKASFSDEKLKVSVKVDAKVDIPKTDKMSVLRIKQKKITQDFLDKVRKTLIGDKDLYDGGIFCIETKEQIEATISSLQQLLKEEADQDPGYLEEYQKSLDKYKKKYESAPIKINLAEYKLDNKLHTVNEKLAEGKCKDYYELSK